MCFFCHNGSPYKNHELTLIFILHLHFPPGKSIATILHLVWLSANLSTRWRDIPYQVTFLGSPPQKAISLNWNLTLIIISLFFCYILHPQQYINFRIIINGQLVKSLSVCGWSSQTSSVRHDFSFMLAHNWKWFLGAKAHKLNISITFWLSCATSMNILALGHSCHNPANYYMGPFSTLHTSGHWPCDPSSLINNLVYQIQAPACLNYFSCFLPSTGLI